jgi:endonuclease/exonuclease/phosphatase family metal-dependent hydrolase
VANVSLTPLQPTYLSSVRKVIAAHPRVIMTESDATTGGTFFGELKQLGGLMPIIGTEATFTAPWLTAVKGSLGSAFEKEYTGLITAPSSVTTAVKAYEQARGLRDTSFSRRSETGPVAGMLRVRASVCVCLPLVAAVGCGLVLALTGCSRALETPAAASPSAGSTYTLMQMNLCLSGIAGCYGKVKYPAGVEEAVARIRQARPDAVTFDEACRGDVALIARRTGYHLRFSTVIYDGKPLPCVRPGGRGLFGDAVLTKAAVQSTASRAFEAQAGPERREWLCVSTRTGVDVCTAHLASPEPDEVAANAPQCAELRALLARRAAAHTVIFGGDVNRRPSCAPVGFWTRTDGAAHQDPGSQQVYGAGAFRSPSAWVVPAIHTDHDVLLVRAYLGARR